jgi:hypothetical protein
MEALVCVVDPATKDNFAYWCGRLRPTGGCRIEDLSWGKFAYTTKTDREEEIQKRFIESEPLVDQATHIDIELQNPVAPMPSWMRAKLGGGGRALAGNAVAYGVSKAVKALIVARRRALKLPMPEIRFTHPRSKFFTFGLECPSKKNDRKRLASRFIDAFFEAHRSDPSYERWRRQYDEAFLDPKTGRPKKDDAADVRMGGMSRLVRLHAGLDRLKKQKII